MLPWSPQTAGTPRGRRRRASCHPTQAWTTTRPWMRPLQTQGSPCSCRWGPALLKPFENLLYPFLRACAKGLLGHKALGVDVCCAPGSVSLITSCSWWTNTGSGARGCPHIPKDEVFALGLPIFAACRPVNTWPWWRPLLVQVGPCLHSLEGQPCFFVTQSGFLGQGGWRCEAAVHWGCHWLLKQVTSPLSGRRLLHQPGWCPLPPLVPLGRAPVSWCKGICDFTVMRFVSASTHQVNCEILLKAATQRDLAPKEQEAVFGWRCTSVPASIKPKSDLQRMYMPAAPAQGVPSSCWSPCVCTCSGTAHC